MRQKTENMFQFSFFEITKSLPSVVQKYRDEYMKICDLLKEIPQIINIVHKDLKALGSSIGGRASQFSSESIFRALLVKQKEGIDYREACIRISESEFLQDFCLFSQKSSIDYTLLCKAYNVITPESWELINQLLARKSIKNKSIDVDVIRTDSTVVETNIHWPTDSSLLWDVYRVISRILGQMRRSDSQTVPFRFHDKKVKSLHIFATRYASSTSKKRQRQVKQKMKTLIDRAADVLEKAQMSIEIAQSSGKSPKETAELSSFLPVMKTVVSCARRRWVHGEKVPLEEKVFSIFEPHSELIQRGRREKPIEFGHKIVLNQSKEKFITGYQVLERKLDDRELLESIIDQHEQQYGKKPKGLAGDKGFCPDLDTLLELSDEIEFLEISRNNSEYKDPIFFAAQKFRAGIEGSISCLKRAFRLSRCFFKGFKNFSSAVGSAVFCHNLVVLTRLSG